MAQEMSFDQYRIAFHSARSDGKLAAFVKNHAPEPAFTDWLNSDAIACDELLGSAEVARDLSIDLRLRGPAEAVAFWFGEVFRAKIKQQVLDASVAQIPRGTPAARAYVFARTRLPELYGPPHKLMFLSTFVDAASGNGTAAAIRHLLGAPRWFTGYVELSALAKLIGTPLIALIGSAAEQSNDPTLTLAYHMLTGLDIADWRSWYAASNTHLKLNPMGIYPSPIHGPMFVTAE